MSKTISAVLKKIASFKLEPTDSEIEIFFSGASKIDLFRDLLDMASCEYGDVTDYMHEYKVSRNKKTKITTAKLTLYQVKDWNPLRKNNALTRYIERHDPLRT